MKLSDSFKKDLYEKTALSLIPLRECKLSPCMDAERRLLGQACSNCFWMGRRMIGPGRVGHGTSFPVCQGESPAKRVLPDDWCVFWREKEG